MPLSLQGVRLETADLESLLTHPVLAEACESFLRESPIHPDTQLPSLCLLQGEQVTIWSKCLPGLLAGSQDATTCLIAIIWCPASQYVWAAHIDQNLGPADINSISSALNYMQQPQLYLCGAYCNENNRGPATAAAFLHVLHSMDEHEIHLKLSCIGAANTAADGSPRSRQMVLDTRSSTVHPWLFSDRGPQLPRRFAAQHCRQLRSDRQSTLINIWNQQQQQLELPPFDPTRVSWEVMSYELMTQWPDSRLLSVMSTSPAHEPPWFCRDMRSMMEFLINAQEPDASEHQCCTSTVTLQWEEVQHRWHQVDNVGGGCAADGVHSSEQGSNFHK